jgi:hypothetical protein
MIVHVVAQIDVGLGLVGEAPAPGVDDHHVGEGPLADQEAAGRLQTTIGPLLAAAQRDGRVDPRLTAGDLSRALRAAYGLVVTAAGRPSARGDVGALMRLLGLPGPSPRAGIQAP